MPSPPPARVACAVAQKIIHGDDAKLPRRRRLGACRGAGTRMILFGGWDGSHTCADLIEIDTSPWLRLDRAQRQQQQQQQQQQQRQQPMLGGAPGPAQHLQMGGSASGTEVSAKRMAGGSKGGAAGDAPEFGGLASGSGFGSSGNGGLEVTVERMEARQEEELQRMRGEVARLRMSNELMGRELHKLKSLVGVALPGGSGGGGVDVDSLAHKREVEGLKAELASLRRLHAQEREADQNALHAEMDSLRRMVQALAVRVADDGRGAPPLPHHHHQLPVRGPDSGGGLGGGFGGGLGGAFGDGLGERR